jgi:hypothetical protein
MARRPELLDPIILVKFDTAGQPDGTRWQSRLPDLAATDLVKRRVARGRSPPPPATLRWTISRSGAPKRPRATCTGAETPPLGGIVSVPFAQFSRRRDVLLPRVQTRFRLRHAARPEPVNQHAIPVRYAGWFVGSPGEDHRSRSPLLSLAGSRSPPASPGSSTSWRPAPRLGARLPHPTTSASARGAVRNERARTLKAGSG